jgi:hypothetical protein
MGFVERRTIAQFLYTQNDHVTMEEVAVPPGDRDTDVPSIGGPPDDALGVGFYDLVVAEVTDPISGTSVLCTSEPLDPSAGVHYYRGTVLTRSEVEFGPMALLHRQFVLSRMDQQGWSHVIHFPDGTFMSFDPNKDHR